MAGGGGNLTFSCVDEVGRDVPAIKLQALDDLQLIVQGFAVLRKKGITVATPFCFAETPPLSTTPLHGRKTPEVIDMPSTRWVSSFTCL